ncbi:dnaJ homolog subfamily C member 27-like [Manacus vitellinus]|uniref:dnaJ homolog subfamily C member 27-like n=1 Tax=Manacus vitellinus TaxID=328815 RepID=UPI00115E8059|nr:dnaJ homolog subfamily C member 27-like [Manacus vitellinus]
MQPKIREFGGLREDLQSFQEAPGIPCFLGIWGCSGPFPLRFPFPRLAQSCIIKRYCEKRFVSKYLATIGIDYGVTKVQIRDREIVRNKKDLEMFVRENKRIPCPEPRFPGVFPGPQVDSGKLRSVDESEGRLWAESRGFLYFETSAQTGEGISEMFQTFYSAIVDLCDNGGKRPNSGAGIGFTREQADAIRRIRNSKDSWDMLGVKPGATRALSE